MSGAHFSNVEELRGIVVVDEIDLHLHTIHQHEILPKLMGMFPKVQFIVTTHSPLFVLGMAQAFGEDGFAVYRLPQGQQISPEEFSEFTTAYQAFATTSKFSDDIRTAIIEAQSPILYMEGKTDVQYLKRAAELLGKESVLAGIEIKEGGGKDELGKIWNAIKNLSSDLVPRPVVLLFDCDYKESNATNGNRFRRRLERRVGHLIEKGIENMFPQQFWTEPWSTSRLSST